MKVHQLKLRNGEMISIHETSEGHFACPVCGDDWGDLAPYSNGFPCDANGKPIGETFAFPSHDICPCCDTHFGPDDYVNPGEGISTVERWEQLRAEWLKTIT